MTLTKKTKQSPLSLDEETMRRLGYQAVDAVIAHYMEIGNKPVASEQRKGKCLPDSFSQFSPGPGQADEILDSTLNTVFKDIMNLVHPRFYAYIPGPSNFVSTIADLLVSGFNVFAGTAPHNLGPYEIEQATIRWLCDLAGMDEHAGGLFVSGGSVASLTALTAARHIKLNNSIENTVIYYSSETHSSIDRALFILGFKEENVQEIPVDDNMRMRPESLISAIKTDKSRGKMPFCVVGTAGTTNTGAIDPLAELAAICEKESLWFHVDAAYGGGGLLADSVKQQFLGIERADTIALDPHKWLFQPYECGCVLARNPRWLQDTFRRLPEYMRDTDTGPEMMNYRDMSPQVTRSFKAFKLWLSLQVFGTDAFSEAVEHGLHLARFAEQLMNEREDWQVITPATLGVVTFRYVKEGLSESALNELNAEIVNRINDDGFAFFSSTVLSGKKVNRMCPLHPGLTEEDITQTVDRLGHIAESI